MAAARLVSTPVCEIRHAPIAMNTVSTTGNSSGSIDIPTAMPASSAVEPTAAPAAVEHDDQDADRRADNGECPHQPPGLCLQARRFGLQRAERMADPADLACRAGRGDLGNAPAAHDQRAGKHARQVLAARMAACRLIGGMARPLAHRHRFARQQRFICLQVAAAKQDRVGGDAVALGQHDQIAAHHLAPGDAPLHAIANDQRAWAGQVAQRLQHALGARLLNHRDHHRHGREAQQDQRLMQAAEQQVDGAAAEQQRQHRFAHHLEGDARQRAAVGARQLVVPFHIETGPRFRLGETAQCRRLGERFAPVRGKLHGLLIPRPLGWRHQTFARTSTPIRSATARSSAVAITRISTDDPSAPMRCSLRSRSSPARSRPAARQTPSRMTGE